MQGIKVIKSLDTLNFIANSTRTIQIPKAFTIGYLVDADFTTTIAGAPATITAQSLARTVANSLRIILNGADVRYNCSGEFLNQQNVFLTGNPTTTTIANAVAVGGTQRIQFFIPTCTKGMTIDGVKKHLKQNKTNLDDPVFNSIRARYLKNKLSNIKIIIKSLKN